jgi:hypothetical protein
MKAWKTEYLLRKKAFPDSSFEEFWEDTGDKVKQEENTRIKLLWDSRVPGSGAPEHLIVGAVQAAWNRGYDVRAAEKLLSRGFKALQANDFNALRGITAQIFYELSVAPRRKNDIYFKFTHPESFEDISADFPNVHFSLDESVFTDRVCGGWYGQIAGASMGTKIEGYRHNALVKFYGDRLGEYLEMPDGYNDDITYEIAFLDALKEKGTRVSPNDIAVKWAEEIPFGWSAEQIALENIRKGIMPPR